MIVIFVSQHLTVKAVYHDTSNLFISKKVIPVKYYQATHKDHLSSHVKNVHQKSENINCSECNKYIQKKSLKRHMKIFHTGEQTQYSCNLCTYQSIHQYVVNNHALNVHQKCKKYFLCLCLKSIFLPEVKKLQAVKNF